MMSGTSAGFGRRLAALIYDSLLLAALLMIYTAGALLFTHGTAVTEQSAGFWWYVYRIGEVAVIGAYYVVNLTRSGQTLGMRAWHLRAVSDTGKPLKFAAAALRSLYAVLAWAPAALGVLWLYLDPEHLALHDRLSRTRMLHLTGS
jgi:uncharacterized RDD family membrane protein YckC